jgi:hypothetical protein
MEKIIYYIIISVYNCYDALVYAKKWCKDCYNGFVYDILRSLKNALGLFIGTIRRQYIKPVIDGHEIVYTILEIKRINGKFNITFSDCSRQIKGFVYEKPKQGGGGFGRTAFVEMANGRPCTMYTIEVYNKNEKFIKIGITSRSTEIRFKKSSSLPYKYRILNEVISDDAAYIWDLEKSEHNKHKQSSYIPKKHFAGYTECFNKSICLTT